MSGSDTEKLEAAAAASSFGDGSKRGAFLNSTPSLQWQNVFGRIPHGQGLKEPTDAEETVKRFLGKPGVAGFLVTSSRHKPVHANEYMRLYAMLEEAGQVLAFHSHLNWRPLKTWSI